MACIYVYSTLCQTYLHNLSSWEGETRAEHASHRVITDMLTTVIIVRRTYTACQVGKELVSSETRAEHASHRVDTYMLTTVIIVRRTYTTCQAWKELVSMETRAEHASHCVITDMTTIVIIVLYNLSSWEGVGILGNMSRARFPSCCYIYVCTPHFVSDVPT